MKKNLATIIMGTLAILMMGAATLLMPRGEVAAAVTCPAGSARTTANDYTQCNMPEGNDDSGGGIWKTVNTIINVVLGILGILAVGMIIFGGFKFVTSAGDATKVKSGKDTIMYGVIGLVVALLAFAIVNFVVASFFSKNYGSYGTQEACENAGGAWSTTSKKCTAPGSK